MSYSSDSDSDSIDRVYTETNTYPRHPKSSCDSRSESQKPLLLSKLPSGAIPLTSKPPDCSNCQGGSSHRRNRREDTRSERPRTRRVAPRSRDIEYRESAPVREVFRAHLESVTDVFTPYSKNAPRVRFVFTKTLDDVVMMQWEEFSFTVGASGICGVNINQEYDALPPFPMLLNCPIIYRGIKRMTTLSINRQSGQPFRFNFFYDGSAEQVMDKDRVTIPSSCVSWMAENLD